jgi:hypothetical protein
MSAPGTISPVKAAGEHITYFSRWEIGASGAHTKDYGVGFASVARNIAGDYTITFTEVPEGPLVDVRIQHWPQAANEPKLCCANDDGYTAASKTLLYKAWDVDETQTLIEIPSGDKVTIACTWLKTK